MIFPYLINVLIVIVQVEEMFIGTVFIGEMEYIRLNAVGRKDTNLLTVPNL
ncbi:hypothetical protein [Oceanobacillus locisalsi]|uniref:Uncharacterized protein n=1 Tax=Oceanobacillus locisalsi TaxID=546107 RepID=A0ABW3NCN7_9BACI